MLIIEKLNEVLHRLDHDGGRHISRANLSDLLSGGSGALEAQGASQLDGESLSADVGQDHLALDGLQIPSFFSSTDSVLGWPIFGDRFHQGYLAEELFISDYLSSQVSDEPHYMRPDHVNLLKRGICEDDIPGLVDRFLHFVHIKNPILDSKSIRQYAARVVENGLDWDAPSCVVVSRAEHFTHSCCLRL